MTNQQIACPLMVFCLAAGAAAAAEQPLPGGEQAARQFWAAVAGADTQAMEGIYAPKVLLKAGSELLKKQWGIEGAGDRDKDLLVDREALLGGYRRMIDKIGKERWVGIFSKIKPEKITTAAAPEADRPFAGVSKGDVVLKVATGPGDDTLFFVLRPGGWGRWLVVAEATDY